MKEIGHRLRKAYIDLLSPLVVESVTIPIMDMTVNPNISIPTYRGGKAYVLVTNQTEVETTNNSCSFRQTAVLELDVIVQYPNGSGSRLATELICDVITQAVVSLNGQNIEIDEAGFQVLGTQKTFAQSFIEIGQTLTSYRKRLTFSQTVYQSQQTI